MNVFQKLKESFAGWSAWVLAKKLAGRAIPVAAAGAATYLSKWAPDTTADGESTKAAIGLLLWAALEAARNAIVYAVKKGRE